MTTGGFRTIAQTRDRLGESPLWHPGERALYWIDWYGPTVHRLRGDAVESWTIAGATILGSLVFVTGGRLLLALDDGLKVFDPKGGGLQKFADPNRARADIMYNDSKVDRFGRLWIGTFDVPELDPRGILYCLDASGNAVVADSGFVVCNGPAFSPDGATLYFSDTMGRRILAYDMAAETRCLKNRRVFASIDEGLPDGLTVDTEGCVWCAHYGAGRITRFGADGKVRAVCRLPCTAVTSCCLGGENLSTLYATTGWSPGVARAEDEPGPGGALLAMDVDANGLAEPEFAIALT